MTDRIVKIILRGDISGLTSSMTAAASSVRSTTDRITNASRESERFRQGLSSVGKAAGAMGLVAAGGVGLAIKSFADFDQAMSHVAATGADAAGSIDALREAAIAAGARTQYSAKEAANGIEELAKAGVTAKDILAGGLDAALDLAAAGGLSVADAASIAATTLNQFGISGDKAGHIADVLSSAANAAQGSVADVGEAMKYVGPVASQMGVSLEETTGTIAELASQGILAGNAGTALRGVLSALTSPSQLATKEMERYGISVYDATGNFVGFKGVAEQLHTTLGGLSNAERDQALGRIFGNEQITAARILYAGGAADVEKWTKAIDLDGAAAATAAVRMDNLKGDLEQLKGSLETAFIGTGEGADGPLRSLTQDLTELVNTYNKLPEPVKSAVLGFGAVTAAAGATVFIASKAITSYADMRVALTNLGVAGTRAAVAMRALGVAGLAFAAVDIAAQIGDSFDKRDSKDIDKMADSLKNLAATGKATGDLADLFGDDLHGKAVKFGKDLGGIGEAIHSLPGYADDSSLVKLGKFFGTAGQVQGIEVQAEAVQDLDKALSSLAQDDPDAAITAFGKIRDQALKTGASAKDVAAAFPTMTTSLLQAAAASGSTSSATQVLTGDLNQLTPAVQQAAEAQKAAQDGATKTGNAFLDITKGIDDAKVSLHDWISQMAQQARALNEFGDNARKAGKRGLDEGLIAELQKAGPEGAMRLKQLADASDSELARANLAYLKSQQALSDYVAEFGQVPTSLTTDVGITGSGYVIQQLNAMNAAAKAAGTNVHYAMGSGGAGGLTRATGGPVYGPGTSTSDSIPAYLSNGEYVVKTAAVQKYGVKMFDNLNAMKYASGGLVDDGKARYDTYQSMQRSTALDIAHQRQEVLNLEKRLKETETVGKGKSKKKRKALRGYDRHVAELELAKAKADLAKMQADNIALKAYGSDDEEQALYDTAQAKSSAAKSFSDNFSIGTLSSTASVDRQLTQMIANAATFTALLSDLKAKGASPWLLAQLVAAGPTPTAIRLARQYDTDTAALASINALSAQWDQVSGSYANLTTDPRFMAAGAWNSGMPAPTAAPVTASIVGAEIAVGQNGLLHFVKGQIVMASDAQAVEARMSN